MHVNAQAAAAAQSLEPGLDADAANATRVVFRCKIAVKRVILDTVAHCNAFCLFIVIIFLP